MKKIKEEELTDRQNDSPKVETVSVEVGTMLDYQSPMSGELSKGVDLTKYVVRGVSKRNILRRKQQGWVETGNTYEELTGMMLPKEEYEKRQSTKQAYQDSLLIREERARQDTLKPKQKPVRR